MCFSKLVQDKLRKVLPVVDVCERLDLWPYVVRQRAPLGRQALALRVGRERVGSVDPGLYKTAVRPRRGEVGA